MTATTPVYNTDTITLQELHHALHDFAFGHPLEMASDIVRQVKRNRASKPQRRVLTEAETEAETHIVRSNN